jgi:hypothetical protein
MITFNFSDYFRRLKEAPDSLSESYVRRDKFRYYDSLSKEEQIEFKNAFSEYLKAENIKIREQIAIGKQMMIEAGIPIS